MTPPMPDLRPDDLSAPDARAAAAVRARAAQVLRPPGALARLDEVAVWLAGWQRSERPRIDAPALVVFAGDHGVCARGVSAFPAEVTRGMVTAITNGWATSSVFARAVGASCTLVDCGVGDPTGDLSVTDALTPERFAHCWHLGVRTVDALPASCDLLVLGEMGIGNTTPSAAVAAALFGGDADTWIGRGTGVDDEGLARKAEAVRAGLARIGVGCPPLEVLRRLGGAELVGIAGAVWAARRRSLPVVLDGYVVTAAVAPLALAVPGALDHGIAAHRSAEPGHRHLLDALGLRPLLDLDLRLGEGSAALAVVPLLRLAVAGVVEVATFTEAGLG
jgi:nicotinate-nucleotide--dimethylbenzimidazole phosphoribosyltransferase